VKNLPHFNTQSPTLLLKMSENYKELKAVQQEIKELLKKKSKLRKKEQNGQLGDEEEIELEEIAELLAQLKEDKDRWFKLV